MMFRISLPVAVSSMIPMFSTSTITSLLLSVSSICTTCMRLLAMRSSLVMVGLSPYSMTFNSLSNCGRHSGFQLYTSRNIRLCACLPECVLLSLKRITISRLSHSTDSCVTVNHADPPTVKNKSFDNMII